VAPEALEVGVGVKYRQISSDCGRGDEAVDQRANGLTAAATRPVESGSGFEVVTATAPID
jgi:hypothetical protein